jgi:hypothetical protein
MRRILDYIGVNTAEFTMGSFIILYWGFSMHSPLNLGVRYILPTFPFIYILAAGVWRKWITQITIPAGAAGGATLATMMNQAASAARSFMGATLKYVFLVLLVIWLALETFLTAPYFLSYFNEFGGGVWNGYHYVTDSNYDWGQDLFRLQTWVNANPQVDKIAVDYFGGGDPHYYLGDKEVDWNSSMGNPTDHGIHWFAISIDELEGGIQPLAPGQTRDASDTFSWLTSIRPQGSGMGDVPPPDYRVGTSIFIYHL